MKRSIQRILPFLGFAISFAILAFLFRKAWNDDEFKLLVEAPKQWWQLGLGLLAALTAVAITFVRWFLLVRALDLPFRLSDSFRLGFIGYFLNFVTIGVVGGDALKAVFLSRQLPKNRTQAVATVVLDRVIGLFGLFLLTSIAFLFSDFTKLEASNEEQFNAVSVICKIAIGLTIAGIIALACLAFASRIQAILLPLIKRLPLISVPLEQLVYAAVLYQRRQLVVHFSVGLSLVVHLLNVFAIYMLASGLPGEHPGLTSHTVIVPMALVAGAVPLPAGMGSFEGTLVFLYQGVSSAGAQAENGFLVAFAYRLCTVIIAAIGVVFYFVSKREIRSLIQRIKSQDQDDTDEPDLPNPPPASEVEDPVVNQTAS